MIGWINLKRLYISKVKLDECLIENILTRSPVLETLELDYCFGYKQLDISSKSVKNLVFSGYWVYEDESGDVSTHVIEINAPNILTLTIQGDLLLWKLLLLDVSSLVEANLDYVKYGHFETTSNDAQEEILNGFMQSLRHVKELKIGKLCLKVNYFSFGNLHI